MDLSAGKFSLLLLLIGLGSHLCNLNVYLPVNASSTDGEFEFERCERAVKKWVSNSVDVELKEDKHTLRDLLFFLHIPRTGGRTYFHCFLRKLYPSNLECPRSYDKLRLDPRKPNCRLLVTHDDYSVMSKLPKERTSVVTILRNPLDRVFSTYEFSIEVAARFLVHPNLTSATRMSGRIRKKSNAVSTLDIWPWKYLVPWMREDLFSRREMRRHGHLDHVRGNDSYNMEDMAMPLDEFINHPVSSDIIHNGATFQIAGLTNNSYVGESHEVRHCVQKYHSLGNYVLEVAKRRLDHMLYVGVTEDHKGSATMFGHVVGAQVISQIGTPNLRKKHPASTSERNSSIADSDSEDDHNQNGPIDHQSTDIASPGISEAVRKTMSVGELMEAYETCIAQLWKSQSVRRVRSLTRIHPVNFTKKARVTVYESTLQRIRSLNWLDEEIYKYAQGIVSRQHDRFQHKLEKLSEKRPQDVSISDMSKADAEQRQKIVHSAKVSLRNRRNHGMQVSLHAISQSTLLDSVCWSISEPPSTATIYSDAVAENIEAQLSGLPDAKDDEKVLDTTFSNLSRPLNESEKNELIFRRHFITILFPVDRFSEMGPSSRSFYSEKGFTCLQILDLIYIFYQEHMSDHEVEAAIHTDSRHADRLRSMYSDMQTPETGHPVYKRIDFMGSRKSFEMLKRISGDNTGNVYELVVRA